MYEQYLDTWTMRAVFNVTEDIFMIPGNCFQIVANSDGATFRIVDADGELDKDWSTCTNLTPIGTQPVAFGVTEPFNSTDMSRMTYQDAYLKFLLKSASVQCLKGTVTLRGVSTDVWVFVGTLGQERLILMSVESAHQSGSVHGDNR